MSVKMTHPGSSQTITAAPDQQAMYASQGWVEYTEPPVPETPASEPPAAGGDAPAN